MTTIELTKEQVEELKSFYKIELEKSLNRTNEIKAILYKLETKPEPLIKSEIPKQKPEKLIVATVPQETNKNIKWSGNIIKLLKENEKPLSLKEITKILVIQNNIPKSDLKKTNYAIQQSIYRLRTINNMVQSIKVAGKKERLFVLTERTNIPEPSKSIVEPQSTSRQIISKPVVEQEIKAPTIEKYNWQGFVKETLESKKRVLSLNELLNVALKHFNLKDSEKSRTRGNLAPVLTKLVKKDKILKTTVKKGVNGRSYGLKEWFDETGNLVSIYK
jgi:hypothetical protein